MIPLEGWQEPDAIDIGTSEPFPIDALRHNPVVRDFVQTVTHEVNGGHLNLVAASAFAVLSGAMGAAKILVKDQWIEPGPLWTCAVAGSGAAKSPVMNTLTAALTAAEERIIAEDAETRGQRALDAEAATEAYEAAAAAYKEARKVTNPNPAEAASLTQLQTALDEAEKARDAADWALGPVPKILLHGSGSSLQAVHDLLAEHQHLLMVSDEGTDLFRTMANKNNEHAQILLKAHGMTRNERNLITRAVRTAAHPALSVGLLIQPKIILEYAQNPDISDVGFQPRFLTADARGAKKRMESSADFYHPAHPNVQGGMLRIGPAQAAWETLINREVQRTWRNRGEATQWIFADARTAALFASRLNVYLAALNNDPDQQSHVHAAADKLRGLVLRLARLLAQEKLAGPTTSHPLFGGTGAPLTQPAGHTADGSLDREVYHLIDYDSVNDAWDIALWSWRQYRNLFSRGTADDIKLEDLALQLLRIASAAYDSGVTALTVREFTRKGVHGATAEEIRTALTHCAEAHWLHAEKVGRSTRYHIHPDITKHLEAKGMLP